MSAIDELRKTMARLRGPGGCPWDHEQTHKSLARCLIEECAELLDTIDRDDMEHMREELGDVLLQVVFHSQMAEEKGLFSLEEVAADINEKLVRRHPHVFGTTEVVGSNEVLRQWEAIKAAEKKNGKQVAERKLFKELPPVLPALLYAWEVVKQAERLDVIDKVFDNASTIREMSRGLDECEAGRLLFEVCAACRFAGVDPESALRRHVSEVVERTEKTGFESESE